MSKVCSRCKESKPVEAFYKRKINSDGLYGKCKPCWSEYIKEYRANNIEKIKEYSKTHYIKYQEKYKERRIKNIERFKERDKKYYAENKEKIKEYKKEWNKNNLDKRRDSVARRRAAKMQRTPCWLTEYDRALIQRKYTLAQKKTESTGERWVVDHILPLRGELVSGLHVPANLRVIKETTNARKYNKYIPV